MFHWILLLMLACKTRNYPIRWQKKMLNERSELTVHCRQCLSFSLQYSLEMCYGEWIHRHFKFCVVFLFIYWRSVFLKCLFLVVLVYMHVDSSEYVCVCLVRSVCVVNSWREKKWESCAYISNFKMFLCVLPADLMYAILEKISLFGKNCSSGSPSLV